MEGKYINNRLSINKEKMEIIIPKKYLNAKKYLEVGFGGGEFLINKAREDKKSFFIGLELSLISLYKIQKICTKNNITNTALGLIDARFALNYFFDQSFFDGIYMNFPCPWPKKKHSDNRLNDLFFSKLIAKVLKTNGFFQLHSDSKTFVENFGSSLEKSNNFKSLCLEINPEIKTNTKYENKWKKENKKIYKIIAYKKTNEMNNYEPKRRIEMPHFKLKDIKNIKILKEEINKIQKSENSIFVYKRILKELDKDVYKIETLAIDIMEGNKKFEQKIIIVIRKRENDWIVKLDDFVNPFRTEAVKNSILMLEKILV